MPQAEGRTRKFKGEEEIDPKLLEAIDFGEKEPQLITYDYPEFSAVCPFSGLPDIARVVVEIVPSGKIPELRQLKYYYLSFREVGIYQELATDKIFRDLWSFLSPLYMKVTTVYNIRGGLLTTAAVERGDKETALHRGAQAKAV